MQRLCMHAIILCKKHLREDIYLKKHFFKVPCVTKHLQLHFSTSLILP